MPHKSACRSRLLRNVLCIGKSRLNALLDLQSNALGHGWGHSIANLPMFV